jgi:hypothetical protein
VRKAQDIGVDPAYCGLRQRGDILLRAPGSGDAVDYLPAELLAQLLAGGPAWVGEGSLRLSEIDAIFE